MDAKKIGAFIAEKRRDKKMTQMQMGEHLGVTAKTISRWENGNYMPDIALLIPIAELLGVTVNELLMGECSTGETVTEVPFESAIEYTKSRRSLLAKRYVYYFRKHKEQQNNQDVLGHLHECSYVLIHVFGLSAGQVTELERNNFCGLANTDIERKYPEEGYEP